MTSRASGDGHILISGTGRAGTTLLVKYFTALGFDTGFSMDEANRSVDPVSNAGLEHVSSTEPLPYVIKSPWYTEILGGTLDRKTLQVKCCIVPVRRLFDAAESRRRSGLWMTDNPPDQERALAVQLYKLTEALARHNIPMCLLHFPTFAESEESLYRGLKPLLDEHEVSREESDVAHREVVNRQLIHRFSDP